MSHLTASENPKSSKATLPDTGHDVSRMNIDWCTNMKMKHSLSPHVSFIIDDFV